MIFFFYFFLFLFFRFEQACNTQVSVFPMLDVSAFPFGLLGVTSFCDFLEFELTYIKRLSNIGTFLAFCSALNSKIHYVAQISYGIFFWTGITAS